MSFTLTFTTSNVAFDEAGVDIAVSEILTSVAARVANGTTEGVVRDHNGNTVGEWALD